MTAFISHSAHDAGAKAFLLLLDDLSRMKQPFWIDDKLRGGQSWWDEILKQIRECDFLVLVLTKRSIASEPCRRELHYAIDLDKPILPVRLDALPDWQLPAVISHAQVVDYTGRTGSSEAGVTCAFLLKDAVDEMAASAPRPLPDPLPQPPDIPPTRLHDLQPFLQARELSLAKQDEFLQGVRAHLDDEDEDRKSLAEVLELFRKRQDIAVRVAREIDELLKKLNGSGPSTADAAIGGAAPSSGAAPRTGSSARTAPEDGTATWEKATVDESTQPASSAKKSVAAGSRVDLSQDKRKVSRLHAPNVDVEALGQNVCSWYESRNLEAQVRTVGGRVIVQCRSRTWARRVGAGVALTVQLVTEADELVVEIGGGKWLDKVAVAGAAWFVLWPAIIPATMGSWKQMKLPNESLQYIEQMIPLYSQQS